MRTAAQRLAALKEMAEDARIDDRIGEVLKDCNAVLTEEQLDALIDEWEAERRQ